jgi:hypothetical protein
MAPPPWLAAADDFHGGFDFISLRNLDLDETAKLGRFVPRAAWSSWRAPRASFWRAHV